MISIKNNYVLISWIEKHEISDKELGERIKKKLGWGLKSGRERVREEMEFEAK